MRYLLALAFLSTISIISICANTIITQAHRTSFVEYKKKHNKTYLSTDVEALR